MFDRLVVETQQLINKFMFEPMETTSVGGSIAFEGATLEVISMEVSAGVPKSPRSPRLKPTLAREGPKPKKDK